jgi:XTP/dITP diphosphohydrolase
MIEEKKEAFGRLLTIMDELREQCPWDRKQTMESLATLTVEETYELIDEIEKGELTGIKEEIGDIMLHMVFYAKIGDEKGAFNIADSLNSVCDKLIRRHPHIYGDVNVEDDEEVKKNWERIKMSEKGKKSVFQGVPNALPAVIKAQRMQEKAAQVGFEWEQPEDVWAKVEEEIGELKEAIATTEIDKKTDEFGDVMFSLINFARFIGVDANRALDLTNRKFKARVEYIEQNSKKSLPDMTLEEMDVLWERAKLKKYK